MPQQGEGSIEKTSSQFANIPESVPRALSQMGVPPLSQTKGPLCKDKSGFCGSG